MKKMIGTLLVLGFASLPAGAAPMRTWILGCTRTVTLGTYTDLQACNAAARRHEAETGHDTGCR